MVAGRQVSLVNRSINLVFQNIEKIRQRHDALFRERGWRRVVGFQTRNPVSSRPRIYSKVRAGIADGLLLHPLVGETKADDFPADVRLQSLKRYWPDTILPSRTILSIMPAAMRYPARARRSSCVDSVELRCSHFIVVAITPVW